MDYAVFVQRFRDTLRDKLQFISSNRCTQKNLGKHLIELMDICNSGVRLKATKARKLKNEDVAEMFEVLLDYRTLRMNIATLEYLKIVLRTRCFEEDLFYGIRVEDTPVSLPQPNNTKERTK
jgi:hypothetical protein